MAKLADAPDLGSGGEILRGSSPLPGSPIPDLHLHRIFESFREYPETQRDLPRVRSQRVDVTLEYFFRFELLTFETDFD